MILAELGFAQTLTASALSAVFTALAVTVGAGLIVKYYGGKTASRRQASDAQYAEQRRKADEIFAERMGVQDFEHQERQREADELFSERTRSRDLEYQTRATLRETYAHLLVAQRHSRQASVRLAEAGGAKADEALKNETTAAHDEFTSLYHRLSLDSSPEMWRDARALNHSAQRCDY